MRLRFQTLCGCVKETEMQFSLDIAPSVMSFALSIDRVEIVAIKGRHIEGVATGNIREFHLAHTCHVVGMGKYAFYFERAKG